MMTGELTVRVELIRKLGGSMVSSLASAEHTYKTSKAANEDYDLLAKMLEKFKAIEE